MAPVDAPGKIVYWALRDDCGTKAGSLKGFGIGEESVQTVLVPSQVKSPQQRRSLHRLPRGHARRRRRRLLDGPEQLRQQRRRRARRVGRRHAELHHARRAGEDAALHGIPAYSKAHWSAGDRIVLLSDTGTLNWVQVDGDRGRPRWPATGDAGKATEPTFSTDGEQRRLRLGPSRSSTGASADGPSDIYAIPYANRAGGGATPLPGASDAGYTEYYPAFSPDSIASSRSPGSSAPGRRTATAGRGAGGAVERRRGRDRHPPRRQRRRRLQRR